MGALFSSLTLLTGGLLAGLALVGVPTLIHLLSRRRARRVRFAPMELLLRSQKRTARSIRLRQLLLLLLRTLFVFALCAAVLRPLWLAAAEAASTTAPVAVIFVIDQSASMNAVLDGKSALERAKQKAKDKLGGLVDDVRTGLVVCGAVPREVVVPTFERAVVAAAIDDVDAGFAFADVGACVDRATALGNAVTDAAGAPVVGARRVVVFSDLAAHGFLERSGDAAGAGVQVDLIGVGDDEVTPNHGLLDVTTEETARGLEVRFRAARYGGPDVEVPADLFLDGRRAARLALPFSDAKVLDRVFTKSGEDAAAASTTPTPTTTTTTTASTTEHTQSVVLGDDALALDNSIELPVEVRPPVRVLLVDGEPDALPFADELFYLTQALSAARVSASGQGRLAIATLSPDRVDAAALVGQDVVVLANVARLEAAAAAALVTHVEAGAGLLMAMGDQVDVDAYNRDFQRLLPAQLRGAKGQALLDDATVADALGFAKLEATHPVLRALAGGDAGTLAGLARVRTTTTMLVEPDANSARSVIMRFENDAPALLERAAGASGADGAAAGRVLLLTTSVDREWTDLPIRPGFLPLVEQLVLYLGRALDDHRPRTLRVGAERVIEAGGAERVVVKDPTGKDIDVDAVVADAADADGPQRRIARFVPERPGLHRTFAVKDGERVLLSAERFTALVDPRESDLRRVSDDDARAVLPSGAVVRRGGDDTPGTPLWPALLLFAVGALFAESLLLRRSGRA
jgi:hypothetical protein